MYYGFAKKFNLELLGTAKSLERLRWYDAYNVGLHHAVSLGLPKT